MKVRRWMKLRKHNTCMAPECGVGLEPGDHVMVTRYDDGTFVVYCDECAEVHYNGETLND